MDVILLVLIGAIVAHRFNRRLTAQEREIARLRQALERVQGPVTVDAAPVEVPATDTAVMVEAPPEPPPIQPPPIQPPPEPSPPPLSVWSRLEDALAGRWLIWLGGATVALAAAFFIKMSIEQGWLGPGVRVALGLLSAAALMVGGEWLRQRGGGAEPGGRDPVPPALTAAGLFTGFASVYGGYVLYDLFAPPLAFALLGGLAALGMALSLLQGPYIAALGLLGGFATPLLVSSIGGSAWGLFAYLLALSGAGMTVVLWRGWRWLGLGTLVGAAGWVPVWYVGGWNPGDALPVGIYLLLTAGLFLMPALLAGPVEAMPRTTLFDMLRWKGRPRADRLAVAAVAVLGLLMAMLVTVDGHRSGSLVMLALFGLLCVAAGRRIERIAGVAWIGALAVLLAFAGWTVPRWPLPPPAVTADGHPIVPPPGAGLPFQSGRFLWAVGGFALLYGMGGFIALWRSTRAALWSSLAAWMPVVLLALAYWRLDPSQADTLWPVASLALAALLVAGTGPLARHRHQPGVSLGLAAFAAGAVGALSLGAVMMLREAWLTVALAAQVPVLAWLERRMGLRSLRAVILLVAGAVLVRLALNPSVLEYGEEGLGWIVYGYGLPAAGFFLAAHWLRSAPDGKGDDGVVALLEAGGLAFVTLLLSLGIQALTRGTLDEPPDTLREVALHTLVWLALALLLATGRRWRTRPVAVWGRRILAGLAALQAAALHLVALNPLWSDEAVGAWPVANTLLLAYGLPALLGLLFLWVEPLPARLRPWVGLLPLMLLGMNLALEIRHAFQGPVLSGPDLPDAEWYGYSVGFLVAAVLMLVAALRYRLGWLRHAAMALILAVVAKVFLSDMAELGGLYRVASFLGLGLSLIGVGYLYRRLQGTAPQGGQTVA
ncbi:DUF2339 domain-containing protein [Azospirillum brasilense]|uniref:DUF2339 domain-containing protein n=2 Tax=Azospirillum brasilense TaxID=192 RepID=UPI000E68DBEE|nr:DUF2339 domain-containing protein [Azospirillum brasilense]NUB31015.1 DUF2339 domain-containing protein [Azospirillum brasilense]RIW02429.1 DUF2339 domain-containing protein [Azospirillum brasilense]